MAAEDYCRIFPAVHEEYEAELLALVRGGEDDINFVLSIPQLLKRRRSLSPH